MKYLIFHLFLKKLIKKNYKNRRLTQRHLHQGWKLLTSDKKLHLDEWYWADSLACKWGYYVN